MVFQVQLMRIIVILKGLLGILLNFDPFPRSVWICCFCSFWLSPTLCQIHLFVPRLSWWALDLFLFFHLFNIVFRSIFIYLGVSLLFWGLCLSFPFLKASEWNILKLWWQESATSLQLYPSPRRWSSRCRTAVRVLLALDHPDWSSSLFQTESLSEGEKAPSDSPLLFWVQAAHWKEILLASPNWTLIWEREFNSSLFSPSMKSHIKMVENQLFFLPPVSEL